jgi:hypothetical protein
VKIEHEQTEVFDAYYDDYSEMDEEDIDEEIRTTWLIEF